MTIELSRFALLGGELTGITTFVEKSSFVVIISYTTITSNAGMAGVMGDVVDANEKSPEPFEDSGRR